MCERCGERVKLKTPNSNAKYCNDCAKHIKLIQNKESYRKIKENVKPSKVACRLVL